MSDKAVLYVMFFIIQQYTTINHKWTYNILYHKVSILALFPVNNNQPEQNLYKKRNQSDKQKWKNKKKSIETHEIRTRYVTKKIFHFSSFNKEYICGNYQNEKKQCYKSNTAISLCYLSLGAVIFYHHFTYFKKMSHWNKILNLYTILIFSNSQCNLVCVCKDVQGSQSWE